MNKSKKLLASLLIFLLVLTGCTNTEYELEVYDKGSSKMTIKYTLSKELNDTINELELDIPEAPTIPEAISEVDIKFMETALVYNKLGYNIDPINTESEVGFVANKLIYSIDSLNSHINDLYELNLIGLKGSVETKEDFLFTHYRFDGDLKLMVEDDVLEEFKNIKEVADIKQMLNKSTAQFKIALPGKVYHHNLNLEESDKKYWDVNVDKPRTEVEIASKKLNMGSLLLVAGGVAAISVAGLMIYKKSTAVDDAMDEFE